MAKDTASPTLSALRSARGAGRRRSNRMVGKDCVVGYVRVSGEEQRVTGLGIEAQENAIRAECERRGVTLCAIYRDEAISGKTPPDKRPGLAAAITALDAGEAGTLMVAKVDRLARSFADLSILSQLSRLAGWDIVALNSPFDMTTVTGRGMAGMMGLFAELESAMASERMVAAAAVRRSRGEQLGRPTTVPDDVRRRAGALRADGLSWTAVAEAMNAEGHVTSKGGRWHAATAQRLAL